MGDSHLGVQSTQADTAHHYFSHRTLTRQANQGSGLRHMAFEHIHRAGQAMGNDRFSAVAASACNDEIFFRTSATRSRSTPVSKSIGTSAKNRSGSSPANSAAAHKHDRGK
ncbi:MAG: hypothetical protein CMM46_18110 [Rhodospirillaceae bacterium]|nr:hypothetical protein [Rhodospirillaceae bacterium]